MWNETSEPLPGNDVLTSYVAACTIATVKKNPAAQALGRLGGVARAKKLSVAELSEIGKKAAQARMKKLSAAERSAIAKKAVEVRIAKLGQKRRKEV